MRSEMILYKYYLSIFLCTICWHLCRYVFCVCWEKPYFIHTRLASLQMSFPALNIFFNKLQREEQLINLCQHADCGECNDDGATLVRCWFLLLLRVNTLLHLVSSLTSKELKIVLICCFYFKNNLFKNIQIYTILQIIYQFVWNFLCVPNIEIAYVLGMYMKNTSIYIGSNIFLLKNWKMFFFFINFHLSMGGRRAK